MGISISFSGCGFDCFFRLTFLLFMVAVFLSPQLAAQWNPLNPVESLQKEDSGLTLNLERGALRFRVCTETMIRVLYSPQREFPRVAEYVVIKAEWPKADFSIGETANDVTLTTAKLKV